MEVYIVTNEDSRYDSYYHGIIGVFDSLEKAIAYMKTCVDVFILHCDQGRAFDNYTIKSTSNPYNVMITDDDSPSEYMVWYIDIYTIQ